MSDIWIFSPLSQPYVKQCLAVADKNDNNKWLKAFGSCKDQLPLLYSNRLVLKESENQIREAPCIVVSDEEDSTGLNKQTCNDNSTVTDHDNLDKICELIENELATGFNLMVDKYTKDTRLLEKLANYLPVSTLEKMCKMFFARNVNNNKLLVENAFKYFFPTYIKKEYNCFTLELLLQANKVYPEEFKILIDVIVNDLSIPNKLLQDYVETVNECEKAKYIMTLVDLDLANEKFVHNLFSIFTAYKGCTKTDRLQNAVLLLLYEHGDTCVMDKNYGRLLLAFLQTVKNSKEDFNQNYMEKIIAAHRSPFKRPCLTIFNELKSIDK